MISYRVFHRQLFLTNVSSVLHVLVLIYWILCDAVMFEDEVKICVDNGKSIKFPKSEQLHRSSTQLVPGSPMRVDPEKGFILIVHLRQAKDSNVQYKLTG